MARRQLALAVFFGLLASGAMVWRGTAAVFSSTTSNASNNWTLGSVTLADDDGGSTALFNATGLVPSSSGSNCITVTYNGNVATAVKLYVSSLTDTSTIAQYVTLTITEGTGGGFGSCGSFVAGTQIYSGTLSAFATASSQYSNGVGTWAPSTAGTTKVYRFAYTINAATPSNKQGTTTQATFQWEAQA